jgi:hypothetical protein
MGEERLVAGPTAPLLCFAAAIDHGFNLSGVPDNGGNFLIKTNIYGLSRLICVRLATVPWGTDGFCKTNNCSP